jgi:hypothetical protein
MIYSHSPTCVGLRVLKLGNQTNEVQQQLALTTETGALSRDIPASSTGQHRVRRRQPAQLRPRREGRLPHWARPRIGGSAGGGSQCWRRILHVLLEFDAQPLNNSTSELGSAGSREECETGSDQRLTVSLQGNKVRNPAGLVSDHHVIPAIVNFREGWRCCWSKGAHAGTTPVQRRESATI